MQVKPKKARTEEPTTKESISGDHAKSAKRAQDGDASSSHECGKEKAKQHEVDRDIDDGKSDASLKDSSLKESSGDGVGNVLGGLVAYTSDSEGDDS
jgi:hypothetical protein